MAVQRCFAAACLFLALCRGQQGPLATFGTTVVIPGGLTGKVYHIPFDSDKLPKFEKLEPVGTIYAKGLFIPSREFSEGFPGVTDRIEWFALDFTGRIYIDSPGSYAFNLCSDDGSKLYLDGRAVIDNDGIHGELCGQNSVKLAGGIHSIRVSYFQGPRYHLSLLLAVARPEDIQFRPFNTDEFQPPSDPADWKYGSPDALGSPADPDADRVRLKDVLRRPDPVVSVTAQVHWHGRAVRDLREADFVVGDEGERQEITGFGFAKQPIDVMLLIDAGESMAKVYKAANAGARRALAQLGRGDRAGVVLFAGKQLLVLDLAANRDMILAAIGKRQPLAGERDLNAAIAAAAIHLRDHARPGAARAIVVITDGDGRSAVSDRAVRDALWQANVTLSGLVPAEHRVRRLIDATGGEAFDIDAANLTLGQLFGGLRGRYEITWRAPGGTPKSIRKIAIELSEGAKARMPDAGIRIPAAYVVPTP